VYSPDGAIGLPPDLNGEVALTPGAGGTRWEQGALAAAVRRDRPDVFFAPGYTGPLLTPVPLVAAIHDVSFAAHPEWFRPREGWRRRLLARATARRARSIVTISEFSRSEIVRHLDVPPDRVRVIPLGVDVHPSPAVMRDPLVLYVGSIFNRRHVPVLVQAFARVAASNPGICLELVGSNRTHPRQDIHALARVSGVEDRIAIRDYVSDAELMRLYERAAVFAFLSEYEGFGLTPVEALAAGAVPVVLDTPVAREAYGEAAVRVAEPDPVQVAVALQAALDYSNPTRRAVLGAATGVLAKYDWRLTASRTLALLEESA
jgi:glycosyltransferase involved in cell wall biosynthesis